MIDLQDYMTHLSAGFLSNAKIKEIKYGKKPRNWSKVWQVPKVEVPLFEIKEDDLP
jgi:hypothetical protein